MVMENVTRLRDLIPKSDNPILWRKAEGGRWIMPPLQSEFLDWLLTPKGEREQETIKAWAEAHGVSPTTPREWKKDRRFRREWEDRANAKNISVDRMQNVIDTLYEAAVAGDVSAAKLYIQEVEKLRPPRQVEADKDVEHLSDEELHAEITELLLDVQGPNHSDQDDAPAGEDQGSLEGWEGQRRQGNTEGDG